MRGADTKPIAKNLIARFGSFAEVISAPPLRLMEVLGVGEVITTELRLILTAALRLLKGQVINRMVRSSRTAILEYCCAAMTYQDSEQLRIVFLDKKNPLIGDELQQEGTVDHTPV